MKSWDWSKIIAFFTSEWQKKLASVVIAILLYYYVNSISYEEKNFNLPIRFTGLPESMVVVQSSDTTVPFTVKGKAEVFKNNEFLRSINPTVNLDKAIVGISNYQIELVLISPQPDLIINLAKDRVTLKIDRILKKSLGIKPTVVGSLPEGFVLNGIELLKKSIEVRGPEEFLESSNFVETLPIDISEATTMMTQRLEFNLPRSITRTDTDDIMAVLAIGIKQTHTQEVHIVTNNITNNITNYAIQILTDVLLKETNTTWEIPEITN